MISVLNGPELISLLESLPVSDVHRELEYVARMLANQLAEMAARMKLESLKLDVANSSGSWEVNLKKSAPGANPYGASEES